MTTITSIRNKGAFHLRRVLSRWSRVVTLFALAWGCAWPAHAALFGDDEARQAIIDLRAKVDSNRQAGDVAIADLRKQLDDQNTSMGRAIFDLTSQLEALRNEVAQLRGQNEQLLKDATDLQRQQKVLGSAVDERLRTLEPVKVSLDGVEFVAQPKEKADFDAAMTAVRGSDFDKASDLFGQFIRRYPDSGYVPSALFWQGNARYASRDYKPAIDSYRALIAKSPTHARAPEAMLAIANCQLELKDVKAAKRTLDEVVRSYPKSDAANMARDRASRLK